jgi:hypothetical protein
MDELGAAAPFGALGGENVAQIAKRFVEIAIDEDIIVFRPVRNFLGCVFQASVNDVATVFGAVFKPNF